MKVLIIVAVVAATLASIGAAAQDTSDVDEILRRLGLSSSSKEAVLQQDLDLDDDDDDVAKAMSDALLSSLVDDDDDDGEGNIMANIMESDEEEATAQFRFIRRWWRKVRRSPVVRFVGRYIKRRVCRG